jgi:hypothetical protein
VVSQLIHQDALVGDEFGHQDFIPEIDEFVVPAWSIRNRSTLPLI